LKNVPASSNLLLATTFGSLNGLVGTGSSMTNTDSFMCVRGSANIDDLVVDDNCALMGLNYDYGACPMDLACMNLDATDLNEEPVPALGVCKKTCFADLNCTALGQTCLIDGFLPGGGYCH
jgi:hypothetical protein